MQYNDSDLFCRDLPSTPQPGMGKILVTGATGYIGGRLVPELLARGYDVRVMVRAASPVHEELWPEAEVVAADAMEPQSLRKALTGIHTAYYLIHSLLLGPEKFAPADNQAAVNFRKAAEQENIRRIIYLGGLGDIRSRLSDHLRSRMEVAQELMRGQVPVTILRTAVIIGSGSASYEIIENLVKNLAVLFLPAWANHHCQPIAIRDTIKYLVGILELPDTAGKSFDIGGPDILTYKVMMQTMADVLGKKRYFITIPFLPVELCAYLTSFFTPVPAPITWCLMEGLKNEVVCENNSISGVLRFKTLPFKEAIIRAIAREKRDDVNTRWSDAYPPANELALKLHELATPPQYGCRYFLLTRKPARSLFRSICRIGGREGWFHGNWMWRMRGMIDRVLMGVGTSRGRRSSASLKINDVIDFWRVEDLRPDEMLLLRAEMKMPGRAWLQFMIDKAGEDNRLTVQAFYHTRGIWGKTYWYIFLPFHYFIFNSLIKQIEKKS